MADGVDEHLAAFEFGLQTIGHAHVLPDGILLRCYPDVRPEHSAGFIVGRVVKQMLRIYDRKTVGVQIQHVAKLSVKQCPRLQKPLPAGIPREFLVILCCLTDPDHYAHRLKQAFDFDRVLRVCHPEFQWVSGSGLLEQF